MQSDTQDEEDSMTAVDGDKVSCVDMSWRPQRLVGVHKNPDGVQASRAFVITSSGAANEAEFGVDVVLIEGGTVLVVSEEPCPLIGDPDEFCALHKKTDDMTDDECFQRRLQMKQSVRDVFADNADTRGEFRIRLPFKVEPASLQWECVGTETGHRICHVDTLEKKKAQEKTAHMAGMGKSKSVVKKQAPTTKGSNHWRQQQDNKQQHCMQVKE